MPRFAFSRRIDAPVSEVFAVFADLERAAGRIPAISRIELLTPGPVGTGTRFRETRTMFGREATEEMRITAFEPCRSYEVTCRTCGADYVTSFDFRPDGAGTLVDAAFRTEKRSLAGLLLVPFGWLLTGMMRKCVEQDVDELRKFIEGAAKPTRAAE
jgi:hypothetical protein